MIRMIFMVLLFLGFIALQIFLSLRDNKWYGLVLPALYLLMAAFAAFAQMVYTGDIMPILLTFLMLSIPAGVNFVIYLACREKVKGRHGDEIQKMNIQDLD